MKKFSLFFALVVWIFSASSALGSVTIQIQNIDPPGSGFNDPTPRAPVGGNSGTTLGQQRLIAFQFAADIWGATLNSSVPVVIRAQWDTSLFCDASSATLGAAGTLGIQRDFPGAPFPATWYSTALANALSGTDRNGATAEISARFNPDLGTPGCLPTATWYLGLDGNHGDNIDLVSVLLHEFGHGLGFQSFTDEETGQFNGGFISVFDKFLFDNTANKTWEQMTAAERVASAVNDGHLTWNGPRVVADVPNVLGTPRLRINSPPGIAGNYTVGTAEFGARLSSPGVTANVIRALDPADGVGPTTTDGCSPFTNAAAVAGNIAFIDRGTCLFVEKVQRAQQAGAIGVIVGNVASSVNPNTPPAMGGSDPTLTIPVVSLALNDADAIRAQLGGAVNGSILLDHSVFSGADSSNRALIFAPNPVDPGSSISHFDDSAYPNQLMEPNNSDDLTHSVTVPQDLSTSLMRDIGWTTGSNPSVIQLSQAAYVANENATSLTVTVNRSGDTTGAASVQYTTSDTAGASPCDSQAGAASSRCDYLTTLGTLDFAAGQTSRTIMIPIIDDVYDEPNETFTFTLSSAIGATLGTTISATLTINDNESVNGTNPIDTASFFVRQHYIDFLNREPDAGGLAFWTNEITSCGANAQCIEVKRINVSAAFFLSIEFQETGYLVYRMYKIAFGNLGGAPVPITFTDFLRDTQKIGQGIVVGSPGWEAALEASKQAYALAFVQRSDFLIAYPNTMTAAEFVDKLNLNAGGVLSATERNNLIASLTNPSSVSQRATVVRQIAEDSDLRAAEFNRAFVLMQYFGYMRRNPNDLPDLNFDGYNFWLNKLNTFGNYVDAEMVKAFIVSGEYRRRFGP